MGNICRTRVRCLAATVLSASAWAVGWAAAADSVIVNLEAVEPAVLHTTTGGRVEFVNRTGRAVHLQFGGDPVGHQVIQVPITGPFWVVFHRAGTHPYVVHVYGTKERALTGVVEVTEGPQQGAQSPSCGVAVRGVCIEP